MMAASNNYSLPPGFNQGKTYDNWKNEVEMWTRVTDLDKKKQAMAVALLLNGRPRDIALGIQADDLNKDDGMSTLFRELDKVFVREEKYRRACFEAISEFDRISRKDGTSMAEYIAEFEQKYNKLREFNIVMPDAILAFKFLNTAGIYSQLDVKDKQLALTACGTHTFADMMSTLKRGFGEKTGVVNVSQDAPNSQAATGPLEGTNKLDKSQRMFQLMMQKLMELVAGRKIWGGKR